MNASSPVVPVENLKVIHAVQAVFEGRVVPPEEVKTFQTKPISAKDFPVRKVVVKVDKKKHQKREAAGQNLNLFEMGRGKAHG